jgi:hypothetical protein
MKIGIFNPDGEISLHPGISVSWKSLSNKPIPDLPPGTPVEIDISLDETPLFQENMALYGLPGISGRRKF